VAGEENSASSICDYVLGAETYGGSNLDGARSVHDCMRLTSATVDDPPNISNGEELPQLERNFFFLSSLHSIV
jgi:hypothetical protein